MTAYSLKRTFLLLAGLALLLVARSAAAQTACTNDIDCPNAACGGDICDWMDTAHFMMCKPAGSHPAGMDGWCMADTDCKCMGIGAKCSATFSCTFSRPCDAPDAGPCGSGGSGGSGGGGGTGTDGGGGSGGGGGGGGCSVAGSAPAGWSALLAFAGLVGARRRRRR